MEYIRRAITDAILEASQYYSVLTITGPRQVGKTTLCRNLFADYEYINLEHVATRNVIEQDVEAFFRTHSNKMIIDEVHHLPELLSYIQVLVDEGTSRKFVLTGSSNFSLLQQISQSLAGRTALFTLMPFSLLELSAESKQDTNELLFKGLYPTIFSKKMPAHMMYSDYYTTYVERDVHQLLRVTNMQAFQTFIRVCAGSVGRECNCSSMGNEVGGSSPAINAWFSILQASYIFCK